MSEKDKINQEILKNQTTHFYEVINRLKGLLLINSDKELAGKLSMSPNAFHNRKKSNSLPYQQIINIAYEQKVNLNWLINGEGPIYKNDLPRSDNANAPSGKKDVIVVEHSDLVKNFDDKPRALKMNHNLLEIEKKNKQAFRDIDFYIEGVASGLKYSTPEEEISNGHKNSTSLPAKSNSQQKKIS